MSLAATSQAFDFLAAPEVRKQVHRLSVDAYHQLSEQGIVGEKTELIRGVVVDKMSESPLHTWIVERFADWLREGLTGPWRVREGHPITLHDSEPEPDVCVVARDSDDHTTHPTTAALAIEVAVTSEKIDRAKASIYAEAGVVEYWIVLPSDKQVVVHRDPEGGNYTEVQTRGASDEVIAKAFPQMRRPIREFFPPTDE